MFHNPFKDSGRPGWHWFLPLPARWRWRIGLALRQVAESTEVKGDLCDEEPQTGTGQFIPGRCIICGHSGRFHYTDQELWRESLTCQHCLTTSRYRSIARGLLRAFAELRGVSVGSIRELASVNGAARLYIYDTQPPFYYRTCAYPLPDMLAKCGWIDLAVSQYKPSLPMGAPLAPGITNQDLESLTYPDSSFDIVITSDVMEHVRLDEVAHREIRRVLKPGGVYLFTVPHNRLEFETLQRVGVSPDGPVGDVHLLEPEYHNDANCETGDGALSYRVYGRDLDSYLSDLGFSVEYTSEDTPAAGIMSTELFYCRLAKS